MNGRGAGPKSAGDRGLALASVKRRAYVSHLPLGEPGGANTLASDVGAPSLFYHVLRVVARRAQIQVLWIHARRIVAFVACLKVGRGIKNDPGYPAKPAIYLPERIPVIVSRKEPDVAWRVVPRVDNRQEFARPPGSVPLQVQLGLPAHPAFRRLVYLLKVRLAAAPAVAGAMFYRTVGYFALRVFTHAQSLSHYHVSAPGGGI